MLTFSVAPGDTSGLEPCPMERMEEMSTDLEALWLRYGPMVLRRCRTLLRDEQEALDASQDVFVKLLARGESLRIDSPSSFLYQSATNLCLNRIRDRRAPGVPLEEETLSRISRLEEPDRPVEARSILSWLFSRHQPSSRVIAVLHFVDGLTLEEVAREVGMSVSGVRKRIAALRQTLQEAEATP